MHALATPGVLLDGPNAGFTLATPIGLLAAAALAALSTRDPQPAAGSPALRALQLGLIAVMALWVAASLSEVPPLDDPTPTESGSGPLIAVAVVAVGLYAVAAWRYLTLFRGRGSPLMLSVAAAFVLLAEAAVAVTFARSWHATWWEWHLLMLAAFVAVVWTARREGQDERFTGLYLDDTVAGKREVSVVFADLEGFTRFSEHRDPREVSEMLNVYFGAAVPVVRAERGEIDRVMGDAIMAAFNRRGDQPDHAARAARAALAVRDATEAVAAEHPGWPRFRIGVNTGEAMTGVLGAAGGRSYTVVGDAVNVAARLEAAAPVGGVAVSAETLGFLDDADAEPLGALAVKGREGPVQAFLLLAGPSRPGASPCRAW